MKLNNKMIRAISFILILFVLLKLVSFMSLGMDKNRLIIQDHSALGLFSEPDYSIDVLGIGNSNVYSGITPLLWWDKHGITGYTWGEPSQRISETFEYLKMIYRHQKPAVVLIETDCIFRDKSTVDNLDSMVKAKLANIFPVITFHRNLEPHRIPNLFQNGHSLTKGYCIRWGYQRVHDDPVKRKRRVKTKECQPVHPLSRICLRKCINYCRNKGSEVILVSVPAYASWSYKKHNAINKEAETNHVVFLDLNMLMKDKMDWKIDTTDRGIHLNLYGAEKVTKYLGEYLKENYRFIDHRKDEKYKSWKSDLKKYRIMTENIKKKRKIRIK